MVADRVGRSAGKELEDDNPLKSFLRALILFVGMLAALMPSKRLKSPKIGQEIDWKGPAANALTVGTLKNTSMLNDLMLNDGNPYT